MNVIESVEVVESESPEQSMLTVVKETGLHEAEAQQLQGSFAPLFSNARAVLAKSRIIQVTDASQKLEIKLARACRLELKGIRIEADKKRKGLKEESLRRGRAIDGFFNILLHLTESEEKRLAEQEDFAERQAQEREAALQTERQVKLQAFGIDTSFYALGAMPADQFDQLFENSRLAFETRQELARKAEADRIAAETARLAEEARIREENARLKREAEAREAQAKVEREAAEAELRKVEEARQAEARVAKAKAIEELAKQQAEFDRLKAESDAKADAERRKVDAERHAMAAKALAEQAVREKAEAAVKALREAELLRQKAVQEETDRKARAEAEAARKAAAAPDAEKLRAYARTVQHIPLPTFTSPRATELQQWLKTTIAAFAQAINETAGEL